MLALSAEINALMTLATFPPARKWASNKSLSTATPALVAVIMALTMVDGGTFLNRIAKSAAIPTRTPEKSAVIHSPIGIK